VIELYMELQKLRNQSRENYNFDIQHDSNLDIENFMAIRGKFENMASVALLDSASTHTILTNPKFFEFPAGQTTWQHCTITTMAGSRNLRFRKGQAIIGLPGGFPLICERAMYVPDASHSLISYRDLRASQIHVSTAMDNDDEVLELKQGFSLLATAHAGDEGLYRLIIESITSCLISLTNAEEVCLAA
jgi:hypothetical protein